MSDLVRQDHRAPPAGGEARSESRTALASGAELSYQQARVLARDRDVAVRRRLAAREDVAPEILYYLAEDADAEVRRAVATNPATPRHADLKLARDANDDVRIELAHKIARLVPGLPAAERDALYRLTIEALTTLARDALPHVRRVIAEEIKAMDAVPREVVQRLARDLEVMVAAPVLEFSPLLNDADLLEIIHSAPVRGALSAISRRRALAAPVCDAIAATGEVAGVAELLANASAQIREETLDKLIDQAHAHPEWQRPLAVRPQLSESAARRLMRFVSRALLTELERANRLAPAVAAALAERVEARLETGGAECEDAAAAEDRSEVAEQMRAADRRGELDQAAIGRLIRDGKLEHLVQALAIRAEVTSLGVRRIIRSANATALVALAWKAGLDMATATGLQARIANIAPELLIQPAADGGYPIEADELEWRLYLFTA
ncbi:MAG TPA: DUF2336 domain-containing protein [Alphaproteobacteria bacterium]